MLCLRNRSLFFFRMFTYDIVAEGKEPLRFYELFGEKRGYKADFPPKVRKNKHVLIEINKFNTCDE